MNSIAVNSLDAWILAIRPKTLGAILCPVLIGSALAYTKNFFNIKILLLSLVCALLLQILANIVNDYGDFMKGADTPERLGPPRAMQLAIITPRAMKAGIAIIIFLLAILGMQLVMRGGLGILALGLLCIFFSLWYTLGPKPLSYLGFSEFAVLVFFGPVPVLGSYYCQSLHLSFTALCASIGPALLSTALIMTNNLRDISEDGKNNKRTLAVRFGEKFSRLAIIFLICGSAISPLLLIIIFDYSWLLSGVLGVLLIPAAHFYEILYAPVSRVFNNILASIGQSLYLYGIIMSIGIIYGAP
jgi:1,4-dihydroxy-2-naphthoate octaprenyltransferase